MRWCTYVENATQSRVAPNARFDTFLEHKSLLLKRRRRLLGNLIVIITLRRVLNVLEFQLAEGRFHSELSRADWNYTLRSNKRPGGLNKRLRSRYGIDIIVEQTVRI